MSVNITELLSLLLCASISQQYYAYCVTADDTARDAVQCGAVERDTMDAPAEQSRADSSSKQNTSRRMQNASKRATSRMVCVTARYDMRCVPSSTPMTALESPLLATYRVRPFMYTATHVHPDVM